MPILVHRSRLSRPRRTAAVRRSLEPDTRVQLPPRIRMRWIRRTFAQPVQGTAAAHIRARDGSIPSVATNGIVQQSGQWLVYASATFRPVGPLSMLIGPAMDAGATPAAVHFATDPRTGHDAAKVVGRGSSPLGGTGSLGVAQQQSAGFGTSRSQVQSLSPRPACLFLRE